MALKREARIKFMTKIGTENMIERGGVIDRGKEIKRNNSIASTEKGGGRVGTGREGKGAPYENIKYSGRFDQWLQ